MTISVITVGGTHESYPGDTRQFVSGMLKTVTDKLPADRFVARWVGYPAELGNPMPFAESMAAGEQALIDAIDHDPNPVCLLGYSQGAGIVGNVAARLDQLPHLDVRGVGMFADPYRHPGQYQPHPTPPEGYGVCGPRWIDDTRRPVWSLSAQGDPISSLPAGNPLRTLADWSGWMTAQNPQAWLADVVDTIRRRRMQRWWDRKNWRDWGGAIAFAEGLIKDGRHFAYGTSELVPGTSKTYSQLLADQIIAEAEIFMRGAAA